MKSSLRFGAACAASALVLSACADSDAEPASATGDGYPATVSSCGTDYTYDAPPQRVLLGAPIVLRSPRRRDFGGDDDVAAALPRLHAGSIAIAGLTVQAGAITVWLSATSAVVGLAALVVFQVPFFAPPDEITGGIRRDESKQLFADYAAGDGPNSMREWARSLT